jgi:hypothetical protein
MKLQNEYILFPGKSSSLFERLVTKHRFCWVFLSLIIRAEHQDAEIDREAANEMLSAIFNAMVLRQLPHSFDVTELYLYSEKEVYGTQVQ